MTSTHHHYQKPANLSKSQSTVNRTVGSHQQETQAESDTGTRGSHLGFRIESMDGEIETHMEEHDGRVESHTVIKDSRVNTHTEDMDSYRSADSLRGAASRPPIGIRGAASRRSADIQADSTESATNWKWRGAGGLTSWAGTATGRRINYRMTAKWMPPKKRNIYFAETILPKQVDETIRN